jgi:hypothetical protein
MGAVKNALQRDGLDPSIMDLDPGRSVVSQLQAIEEEKEVDKDPPLKNDPTYRCANTFPSMCCCYQSPVLMYLFPISQ